MIRRQKQESAKPKTATQPGAQARSTMTWEDIANNKSFIGGILDFLSRNTKIPVIHRGRIRSMSMDNRDLRIELAPVVRQQLDTGIWVKISESAVFSFEHASLLPDGQRTFPEGQNIKWTIVSAGSECVVVIGPVRPIADGLPPLRETCQFATFHPAQSGSALEKETFGGLHDYIHAPDDAE